MLESPEAQQNLYFLMLLLSKTNCVIFGQIQSLCFLTGFSNNKSRRFKKHTVTTLYGGYNFLFKLLRI